MEEIETYIAYRQKRDYRIQWVCMLFFILIRLSGEKSETIFSREEKASRR